MVDYKNFSDDDDPVRLAFKKLFGDMYLSESETALRIFEYGYKAGMTAEREACAEHYLGIMRDAVAAEREACAKLCDIEASVQLANVNEDYQHGKEMGATVCAEAIRQRGKE